MITFIIGFSAASMIACVIGLWARRKYDRRIEKMEECYFWSTECFPIVCKIINTEEWDQDRQEALRQQHAVALRRLDKSIEEVHGI